MIVRIVSAGRFLLRCSAVANDDGSFVPSLRVYESMYSEQAAGLSVPMHDAPLFESDREALGYAEITGRLWVATRQ